MDILQNMKDFRQEHYLLIALCFLAMFSPGLLGLVIYFPEQFMEISSLKLVVLSLAIGIPLTVPHILGLGYLLAIGVNMSKEEKFRLVPEMSTVFGSAVSTGVSYILILLAYFFSIGLKPFLFLVLIVEILCFVGWILLYRKLRLEKQGT